MLSAEKAIAAVVAWKVSLQPSSCQCAWSASLWTANVKRLIAKGATPELAVEALLATLGPDDRPMKRQCR